MKRILILLVSVLYLSTSLGAGLHLHYCMGKLVGSSFFASEADQCPKCGMEKGGQEETGCCKDEHKQVKVQDDHKASSTYLLGMQQAGTAVAPSPYDPSAVLVSFPLLQAFNTHAPPPPISTVQRYLLHRSLLI